MPIELQSSDVHDLASLGDPVDLQEVRQVYMPLAHFLMNEYESSCYRRMRTRRFLGSGTDSRTPFVVAIAGSVAVGKSTVARLLRTILANALPGRSVQLVSTDGFLLPNDELGRRGAMNRKGWPESYDTTALLRFLSDMRSGATKVRIPTYSHLLYDVVPGQEACIDAPDILIVEGLTVLQPAIPGEDGRLHAVASDFFDVSIYVDADPEVLARWYTSRFLTLRDTAFRQPASYFAKYASLTDEKAVATAMSIWTEINLPNLMLHVLPTRRRATIVLEKAPDHRVVCVRVLAV